MRHLSKKRGFTLVEIMIVVTIIGLLSAIAIPTYSKMRTDAKAAVCRANLRQINGAIEQWAFNSEAEDGMDLGEYIEEIYAYFATTDPACASGGEYQFGTLGQDPQVTCSSGLDGHEYP